jgi:hypothetical protein
VPGGQPGCAGSGTAGGPSSSVGCSVSCATACGSITLRFRVAPNPISSGNAMTIDVSRHGDKLPDVCDSKTSKRRTTRGGSKQIR